MSEPLSGKVVLVTGGAKRVGAAIARRLHREGANLMLHYRGSEREARALRAELNAARADSVALVQADLLDIAGLSEIVRNTIGRFERLDALINNASTFFPTPVGEITQATWDSLMGANLRAPLFLSQAAAPHLKKTGGAIVNIIDNHADPPLKNYKRKRDRESTRLNSSHSYISDAGFCLEKKTNTRDHAPFMTA